MIWQGRPAPRLVRSTSGSEGLIAAGTTATVSASCGRTGLVSGGGYDADGPLVVLRSSPVATPFGPPPALHTAEAKVASTNNSWFVEARNEGLGAVKIDVTAVCLALLKK